MLLPILRSQVQGELLAVLYLQPEQDFSVSELARYVGASFPAVHAEVSRLVESGFAVDSRRGQLRLIRAASAAPFARPLTDLLALTYGPLPVLTDALKGLAGVEGAYIYGSWAARYSGEPGPVPNDIDVLVVGAPDRQELNERVRRAEEVLHREVNVRRASRESWDASEPSAFISTVRSRPKLALHLGEATAA